MIRKIAKIALMLFFRLFLLIAWRVFFSNNVTYFSVKDYVTEKKNITSLIERDWFPEWFPHTARDINVAQTIFDSSFLWAEFDVDTSDDFVRNCEPAEDFAAIIPSADFMKRKFNEETNSSYQRMVSDHSTIYACKDRRNIFYIVIGHSGTKAYMWNPE